MTIELESYNPLSAIPKKKIDNAIREILDRYPDSRGKTITSGISDEASALITAINRYAEANIPVDYWSLDMDNFKGDKILKRQYDAIVGDLKVTYNKGIARCFAGKHGLGKTYISSCILKRAVEKGYSGFYTTLDSIVALMASYNNADKYEARQHLLMVDFLVIDEFDPRFMGSVSASDLHGRILEPTLRYRLQNNLPLFLCTNSSNVTSSFSGALNESISSLMNLVETIPVLGTDYRPIKSGEK